MTDEPSQQIQNDVASTAPADAGTEIDLSGDRGVLKQIIEEGIDIETPKNGCSVSLHYTGTLLDGTKFDSSLDRGEPFEFDLGKGSVIKAFDMCVATMKKGEKCILTCAPDYAYGATGSPPNIPPDSTLKFELLMLSWKGEDISPQMDGSIERVILKKSEKRRNPTDLSFVKVHITGKYKESVFDERDVEFNICEASDKGIISGIEVGLLKFAVGETSKLKIQSKYAFGAQGNAEFNIPGNATVEYIVTLKECEHEPEAWKLTPEESLIQAKIVKEKGTNYLKKEKYELAIKMYNLSNTYIANCTNNSGDEVNQIKIAIFLNIALAYQKLDDQFEARKACESVLGIDSKNIKALYRRGQCYYKIGEIEKALDDFNMVQKLDPNNKAALNQVTLCNQFLKDYSQKEKKLYANMFTKFASVDNEKKSLVDPGRPSTSTPKRNIHVGYVVSLVGSESSSGVLLKPNETITVVRYQHNNGSI